MSATVTRLPATLAVGLREATGRDRFEPTTVAAYWENLVRCGATGTGAHHHRCPSPKRFGAVF